MADEQNHECEDGMLCVCEVSASLKSQKRKCEGQDLANTKRKKSQKITGSEILETTDNRETVDPTADRKTSGVDNNTDTFCETSTQAISQQLRTDELCLQDKGSFDFDVMQKPAIPWKKEPFATIVEVLSSKTGEPATEEMHKLNNERLGSDSVDEVNCNNTVQSNVFDDIKDRNTSAERKTENVGVRDAEIKSNSTDPYINRRTSLRNKNISKTDKTVKKESKDSHENHSDDSGSVRNRKHKFSSRFKQSFDSFEEGTHSQVQMDSCLDASDEKGGKGSVRNSKHSRNTTNTDKRSKLKSQAVNVSCKKRTKSTKKIVKTKKSASKNFEKLANKATEETKNRCTAQKHSLSLRDQVQEARGRRKNPKRLTQSKTENKVDQHDQNLDKFEKLKMSLSDLDSGLSEKIRDIDSFINALNDIDRKLTDSAVIVSKPYKLKPSYQDKQRKNTFIKNSKPKTCSKISGTNSSVASVKVSVASKCGTKVSKKNLITSTPKLQNKKGRRTKTHKQTITAHEPPSHLDDNINQERSESGDTLDYSLPTPTVKDNCTPLARSYSDSVPFDSNLAKDVCDSGDSDEELPVGLTPVKIEKTFQEKDIVWVKWKAWPYLPAMVKNVYKKKKRITCCVFAPPEKREPPLHLSMFGNKVWSYFDSEKKEEILKASESLEPSMKLLFKESLACVDDYLTKKALGQIEDDLSFLSQEGLSGEELIDSEEVTEDSDEQTESDRALTDNSDSVVIASVSQPQGLSRKGELRKEKIREKTQKLIEFLQSAACKKYLQGLFLEKNKSERHKIFMTGSVKEKYSLKHQGYGPIDDEAQIMTLLMTFYEWLQEVNKSPYLNVNDYIMDVWVPEAIVFAYQKYFTYSKKKAWEMFFKGPRRTKEELQQMHSMIIEQANNISPEDRQRFREREEEILRAVGINPDYKPKKLVI